MFSMLLNSFYDWMTNGFFNFYVLLPIYRKSTNQISYDYTSGEPAIRNSQKPLTGSGTDLRHSFLTVLVYTGDIDNTSNHDRLYNRSCLYNQGQSFIQPFLFLEQG